MAYKNSESPEFLDDILIRKEFYEVRPPESPSGDVNEYDSMKGQFLELRGHQLFVNNFQSPDTPYMRLLLKHQTGVGKTLSAIAIAQRFAEKYKRIYDTTLLQTGSNRKGRLEADLTTPSIFIIGFTKSIFIKEILKYPEFGFVTYEEHAELERLQKAALSGMTSDIDRAKEFYSMLKRRITNKTKSGFYKFYGYQEFVNKLFYSDTINLTDLESMVTKKIAAKEKNKSNNTEKSNSSSATVESLEELIYHYMERGEIQVNTTLLKQFENSLLICDEVHSTYNSMMKNNYGVAIQYVLDYTPSLRALFLSATVIYHSPSEIVDLMNLLLPAKKKISKKDFFTSKKEPKPGKLEEIGILSRGYVSFLQETNPEYYPEKIFLGEPHKLKSSITIGSLNMTEIPYLNFVNCPMSEYHEKAYMDFLNFSGQLNEKFPVLPTDAYSLNDIVYPVPSGQSKKSNVKETQSNVKDAQSNIIEESVDNEYDESNAIEEENIHQSDSLKDHYVQITPNSAVGYRSSQIKNSLLKASESWKKSNGVDLELTKTGSPIVTGNWLNINNVGKYSSKYSYIVKDLFSSFKNAIESAGRELDKIRKTKGGELSEEIEFEILRKNSIKIMIYHPRVKFGVLEIEQLLKQNGCVGQTEEPSSKTICTYCGVERDLHTEKYILSKSIPRHEYRPLRLIMAHSDFDKVIMDQSINMYNEPSNIYGEYIKILVGSKIIRQSYDIKGIRLFFIVSLPVSIPELIQILGRVARMGSHKDLPSDKRNVKIIMLISTSKSVNTYEEVKYVEKMAEYKIIQEIEKEINKNAIDADILRSTIMSEYNLRQYFGDEAVDNALRGSNPHEALRELSYSDPNKAKDVFGNLYYLPEATIKPGFDPRDLNTSTFYAYKYFEKEAKIISYIIKRLFIDQHIWKYDDLWKSVRYPPWIMGINTQIISEGNFALVLNALSASDNIVWNTSTTLQTAQQRAQMNSYKMIDEFEIAKKKMIRDLFSKEEKVITIAKGTESKPQRYRVNQVDEFYILFPLISAAENTFTFSSDKISHSNPNSLLVETKDVLIKDVESFSREVKYSPGIRINLDSWVKESKNEYNYNIKKQKFIQSFGEVQSDSRESTAEKMHPMLWEYTPAFQRKFLKEIIEWEVLRDKKISVTLENLYSNVIDLFDEFSAIIYITNILTYREIAKKFTSGKVVKWKKGESKPYSDLDKYTPIGFIDKDSVSLFDGKWFKVSKSSLNIRTEFTENNIIIGYFDTLKGLDDVKFKMRKPVQEIRKNMAAGDIRLLERGIVCETKNKPELLKIAKELKINVNMGQKDGKYTTAQDKMKKVKIKNVCEAIRDVLIDLEARERQKDSKIKYFYMFYDQQPSIAGV